MEAGEVVAVYDARAGRWRRATIAAIGGSYAYVATREFGAMVPVAPKWLRPIAVVPSQGAKVYA